MEQYYILNVQHRLPHNYSNHKDTRNRIHLLSFEFPQEEGRIRFTSLSMYSNISWSACRRFLPVWYLINAAVPSKQRIGKTNASVTFIAKLRVAGRILEYLDQITRRCERYK